MSVTAMAWAMKQQVVKDPAARHVLLVLANFCGENGQAAFPSVQTIGQITGLSERSIQYKLRELEAVGIIRRGNQAIAVLITKRSAKYVPTVYDLDFRRGASSAPLEAQGCNPGDLVVQTVQPRGATLAPDPSLEPSLTTQREAVGATGTLEGIDPKVVPIRPKPPEPAPLDEMKAIFHEVLSELPRVRLMGAARRAVMEEFWTWTMTTTLDDGERRATTKQEGLDYFRRYCERATENDWLMGRTERHGRNKNWRCDIDFLLSERGKTHVIERTEAAA